MPYCHCFKDFIYLFLEWEEEREKQRKKNINWLPLICPYSGARPATQAWALTRNRTSNILVCQTMPNPARASSCHFINLYKWPKLLPVTRQNINKFSKYKIHKEIKVQEKKITHNHNTQRQQLKLWYTLLFSLLLSHVYFYTVDIIFYVNSTHILKSIYPL